MRRASEKRAKRSRNRLITVFLTVVLLVGLCILLYPTVSNWWNERTASRVISSYDEAVAALSDEDYSAYFEAAEAYNQALQEVGSAAALVNPELVEGYENLLDITGTGIMGYITIEKIGVQLPIYHGTSNGVLTAGAGHLEGSSLPVGGEGTHCVISAHRGLPSATLFTNLDQLEEGDTFTITVLDRVFTYEVDQISIVLPDEVENLYIENGEDYCTLMTCTPYGVNSHRLLVRGHRVDNDETSHIRVTAEASEIDTFLVAMFIAIPLLVVLLIWLVIYTHRKKRKQQTSIQKEQDKHEEASL